MTRKQNSTIGKHDRHPEHKSAPTLRATGSAPSSDCGRSDYGARIGASSKWLRGDPPCKPKARGINELPTRFELRNRARVAEPSASRRVLRQKILPCQQKIQLVQFLAEPPHKRLRLTSGTDRRNRCSHLPY